MNYKGRGQIKDIKLGVGKIKPFKVQQGSIFRLTQTEIIINQLVTPIIFGGHFTNQSPNINGNYVT